ncbi:MAG: metallophosphoesterase [Chthoniobacterales bacterium]
MADEVVLDGRLALFHQGQRWLAVADLHYGYELSQRAAGRLTPLWGMASIETRLLELLADYKPRQLVIVGDLVHDHAAAEPARDFLHRLSKFCEVVPLAGNHDRRLLRTMPMADSWQTDGFHFYHGHQTVEVTPSIEIIGHHHPAGSVTDGAGLRLKLPAFVQERRRWIMPAFSPWAAGAAWRGDEETRVRLCSPTRILDLPPRPDGERNDAVR